MSRYSAISAAFASDPMAGFSLTGPQDAWLRMGSPADPEADGRPLLWLGANQIGKSFAQAVKIWHFIRRTGPYANRRPGPVQVCVLSISKEQMVPLMEKMWACLPHRSDRNGVDRADEVPTAEFKPGFGFTGKPPRLVVTSGPGAGSLVTFATYRQGSTRIAGITMDLLILDEPPPESLWSEVALRVMRRAGQIWISMTITPDSPPQEWLKTKADSGQLRAMVTPSARLVDGRWTADTAPFRPVDGLPLFLKRSALQKAIDETLEAERPLRFGASWTGATGIRWLSAWGPHCISASRPPAGAKLLVGIDHSTTPGREAAVLVACVPGLPGRPQDSRFWLLAEAELSTDQTSTLRHSAARILAMLARVGLTWRDVDVWLGDRAAQQVTRGKVRHDNATLRRYIVDALGLSDLAGFPRISVPYKASNTVSMGFSEMNTLMATPGAFQVHPDCKRFIEACNKWEGDARDPHKDSLDAARYPMEAALGGKAWHDRQKAGRLFT